MGEGRTSEPVRLFSDVSERVTDPWLRRAFILAEGGRGTASPNPLVGCVIVSDDAVVGEGAHLRAGQAHAEVIALEDAGEKARSATAYVTLEPCTHHGRTPPCAAALAEAGISCVVIGMRDPNPAVSGGGVEFLKAAGVDVELALDPTPFEIQNEAWLTWLSRSRPFVRVKSAMSIDGRISLDAGHPASMSGSAGAQVTRRLRSAADGVLVGAATVEADDPRLTARDPSGAPADRQPVRVVLGRSGTPPPRARVFTDGEAPTVVLIPTDMLIDAKILERERVRVIRYAPSNGLKGALAALGEIGVLDVLAEPGTRLFTALCEEDLVDELVTVVGGGLVGSSGSPLYDGPADREGDGLMRRFAPIETGILDDVSVTVWRPTTYERLGIRLDRAEG